MSSLKLKTKWVKHPKVPVWENNKGIRIHVSGGLLGKPGTHFLCVVRDHMVKEPYSYFYKLTGGNRKRALMAAAEEIAAPGSFYHAVFIGEHSPLKGFIDTPALEQI
jgi:hypothetical protein